MFAGLFRKNYRPIGVDIDARSVKLVQLSADGQELIESSRWDFDSTSANGDEETGQITEALTRARDGRSFRGKEAVVCLNDRQLVMQNLRVPKGDAAATARLVHQEGAGRLSFPVAEAEIRFIEAADVRQADTVVREVVLLACHKPRLQLLLDSVEAAGLRPVAVDVEPAAWLRSYRRQYRRDDDQKLRALFLHVGYLRSGVAVHQGDELLFAKYVDVGGKHLDEAVAKHLSMSVAEAATLRRRNGDRRADQQDPEVMRSIGEACRPVMERIAAEMSMCIRYHSVTFRGQPLTRLVLGGAEASPQIQEVLQKRLDLKCEMSDPMRGFTNAPQFGGKGQWDVAAGLALRDLN